MDNETLIYLDNRFDSLQKKQDTVNNQLFDKLNAIHEQTIRTNGRVNAHDDKLKKLDSIHENCAGKEALKKFIEQETSEKVRETKAYQIGKFLLNASAVAGIVIIFLKITGK